jgi:hypothetical protein
MNTKVPFLDAIASFPSWIFQHPSVYVKVACFFDKGISFMVMSQSTLLPMMYLLCLLGSKIYTYEFLGPPNTFKCKEDYSF